MNIFTETFKRSTESKDKNVKVRNLKAGDKVVMALSNDKEPVTRTVKEITAQGGIIFDDGKHVTLKKDDFVTLGESKKALDKSANTSRKVESEESEMMQRANQFWSDKLDLMFIAASGAGVTAKVLETASKQPGGVLSSLYNFLQEVYEGGEVEYITESEMLEAIREYIS